MVSSLLEHGQIKTTIAKAKETSRLAEKMITLGKKGDDNAKRQAGAFLLKHDITLPLLFSEYAKRFADRPGGYTRIHRYGNRIGDNAPHAVIELVDGPRDLKFEITARAVGRETVERYLVNGEFTRSEPLEPSQVDVPRKGLLRPTTEINLVKALKYRSSADKLLFQQKAAAWANRIIAEPSLHHGLRHRVERSAPPDQGASGSPQESKKDIENRKHRLAFQGKRHVAGERLAGTSVSRGSSALAIAKGALGKYGVPPKSRFWDAGWKKMPAGGGESAEKVDLTLQ